MFIQMPSPVSVFDINIPRESPVILWHDVINNSVTSHPKHPRTPITTGKELERIPNLVGIVYVQRKTPTSTAPDLFKDLLKLRIPVLHLTKDLLSKQKQNNPDYTKPYPKTTRQTVLGSQISDNFKRLRLRYQENRKKNKRLSQSKRKKAAADVTTKH